MRKYFVSSLIILIMAFTFCIGYFSVPKNIYADSATDQWTTVTTNQELADAFRYYCKSRNLAIEGSIADALTSFTTNSFNSICNTLGIDITALQAHLKRSTDSNGRVQFLFDQFGITAYNRIFAEFLQNNDLEIGDTASEANNTVFDGKFYVDEDGIGCLIWSMPAKYNFSSNNLVPTVYGTTYKYSGNDLKNLYVNGNRTVTFNLNDTQSPVFNLRYYANTNRDNITECYMIGDYNIGAQGWYLTICSANKDNYSFGIRMVIFENAGKYYLGSVLQNPNLITCGWLGFIEINATEVNNNSQNTVIYYTTNNQTINNNTYNDNKQTVINNEGDTYNYDYDDDDPPVNPPSGGGGDDPSGGGGDDDPIDWPNITFPNILPHLQIPNLKDKFPFSIPWDLIAFYAILNVDPVCPEIETDINLGIVQWHVDLSLEDFEPVAEICRDMYFIAFCVGLIIVTRDLIRG